jgi:hypothetical protein
MAVVPRPPAFDAKAFVKPLREKLLKADGTSYAVFGEGPFPGFVAWIRNLRDLVEGHRVQLVDHKGHLDRVDGRELAHYRELKAEVAAVREAQQDVPFPGSG